MNNGPISPFAVADMVETAGYLADVVDDDKFYGVKFRVEGVPHVYELFREDDSYGRVVVRYPLPAEADRPRVLAIGNVANRRLKAVKTVLYGTSHVAFSVEQFFSDVADVSPKFERALSALRAAGDFFFTELTDDSHTATAEGKAK